MSQFEEYARRDFQLSPGQGHRGDGGLALHIRDCQRCHRVYAAAFNASTEAGRGFYGSSSVVFPP